MVVTLLPRIDALLASCIGVTLLTGAACGDDEKPVTTTDVDGTSTNGTDVGATEPAETGPASTAVSASDGAETGEQSDHGECDEYLKCFGALFPEYLDEYREVYGPEGSCWENTPRYAEDCRYFCSSNWDVWAEMNPAEPACKGSE